MEKLDNFLDKLDIEGHFDIIHAPPPPSTEPEHPPPPPHAPPPPSTEPEHPPPPPHAPPPAAREMLTPLVAKALVLRILKEKPSHGYDIAERISSILGRKIAKSRIYNLLNSSYNLYFYFFNYLK